MAKWLRGRDESFPRTSGILRGRHRPPSRLFPSHRHPVLIATLPMPFAYKRPLPPPHTGSLWSRILRPCPGRLPPVPLLLTAAMHNLRIPHPLASPPPRPSSATNFALFICAHPRVAPGCHSPCFPALPLATPTASTPAAASTAAFTAPPNAPPYPSPAATPPAPSPPG